VFENEKVRHLAFKINVNLKFPLYFIKHHAMKIHGGVGGTTARIPDFRRR
jgi:hypothetical protein